MANKIIGTVKSVGIIINPVAGQPKPILHTLNQVFLKTGIDWQVHITKKDHDARQFAISLSRKDVDVIAAYGGDGTIMEAAAGLVNRSTPLAILPGGTANVLSKEFKIPNKLEQAAAIAINPKSPVVSMDVGQIGRKYFLHRVGIGIAADKVKRADRKLKQKYGKAAYSIAALQSIKAKRQIQFSITVDGKKHQVKGITCHIANSGNMGSDKVSLAPSIKIDDGRLDVLVLRDVSAKAAYQALKSMEKNIASSDKFHHWQGKRISIRTDTPLDIQGDGEMWGKTPLTLKIIPHAVNVIASPSRKK